MKGDRTEIKTKGGINMKKNNFTFADVGRHWDATEDYDEINSETYSYARRFVDGFEMSSIKDAKGTPKVLDVCCRTGNGTLFFGKRKKIDAVCLDVSGKMLGIAGKRLSGTGIKFRTMKLESGKFPLKNESFDFIMCFETLEHTPDPDAFLAELSRVLKPGGELVLTMPNTAWEFVHWFAALTGIHHSEGPHQFIPRGEFFDAVKSLGLIIRKEKTTVFIPAGPGIVTRFGEIIERLMGETLRRYVCLRRVFIIGKPR